MPKEPIDITPADSAVQVFLEEPTDAEIAERQAEHEAQEEAKATLQAEQELKAAQKTAILERIGLTEEELQIVLGA
jgi:hypothetical protein